MDKLAPIASPKNSHWTTDTFLGSLRIGGYFALLRVLQKQLPKFAFLVTGATALATEVTLLRSVEARNKKATAASIAKAANDTTALLKKFEKDTPDNLSLNDLMPYIEKALKNAQQIVSDINSTEPSNTLQASYEQALVAIQKLRSDLENAKNLEKVINSLQELQKEGGEKLTQTGIRLHQEKEALECEKNKLQDLLSDTQRQLEMTKESLAKTELAKQQLELERTVLIQLSQEFFVKAKHSLSQKVTQLNDPNNTNKQTQLSILKGELGGELKDLDPVFNGVVSILPILYGNEDTHTKAQKIVRILAPHFKIEINNN